MWTYFGIYRSSVPKLIFVIKLNVVIITDSIQNTFDIRQKALPCIAIPS